MRSVPLHLWRALKEGEDIAAKIEPRFPGAVAWVCVGPYKKDGVHMTADKGAGVPWIYSVKYFEVPQWKMDEEVDVSDEEFHHIERYVVHSLAEVDELLDRLVGDPSKFKLSADWPDYFPF